VEEPQERRPVRTLIVAAAMAVGLVVMAGTGFAAPNFGDTSKPQPTSKADANGTGANPGNACEARRPDGNPVAEGVIYCSMRDGSASLNGNGNGNATGKPCAGCVGRADNKNPVGQGQEYPDWVNGRLIQPDRNQGYECDGNNGIGKTNPAHTLCDP
jgi:hypothetical protein